MGVPTAPGVSKNRAAQLFVSWLCVGIPAGFLLWTLFSGAGEMQQIMVGLRRYILIAPAGLAVAGVVCAVFLFRGTRAVIERLGYAACVFYFGFLKVLGWNFIPWILVVVAAIGFWRAAELPAGSRRSLLLLHVMGTLTGLYMAFHLRDFLQEWASFVEVVRSLGLLTVDLVSRLF